MTIEFFFAFMHFHKYINQMIENSKDQCPLPARQKMDRTVFSGNNGGNFNPFDFAPRKLVA